MAELSKAELARALSVPETDLIGRKAAAALCGVAYNTLKSEPLVHVGFWKRHDTAPVLYRRDWVKDYGDWIKGGKKGKFPADKCGKRPMPEAAQPRIISAKEAFIVIERWKQRQLYVRIEAIFNGTMSLEEIRSRHRSEWLKLYKPDGGEISRDDPALAGRLQEKVKQLVLPYGVIEKPDAFTLFLHTVWIQILQTQADWIRQRQLIPR